MEHLTNPTPDSSHLPPKVLWLLEFIEGSSRQMAETTLDPEDDFVPTIFCMDPDGGLSIYGFVALPTEQLVMAIPMAEQMYGGTVIAGFIGTAWETQHERGTPILMRPEQDPDRREVAIISVAYEDGVISAQAKITRSPNKRPMLGPWERNLSPQHTVGQVATAMLSGLSFPKKQDPANVV